MHMKYAIFYILFFYRFGECIACLCFIMCIDNIIIVEKNYLYYKTVFFFTFGYYNKKIEKIPADYKTVEILIVNY